MLCKHTGTYFEFQAMAMNSNGFLIGMEECAIYGQTFVRTLLLVTCVDMLFFILFLGYSSVTQIFLDRPIR